MMWWRWLLFGGGGGGDCVASGCFHRRRLFPHQETWQDTRRAKATYLRCLVQQQQQQPCLTLCLGLSPLLQKRLRLLRRASRVLLRDHGDPVLNGLQQHVIESNASSLSAVLADVVAAHQGLRAAFEGSLGRDGWGVLQRALRVMAETSDHVKVRWPSDAVGLILSKGSAHCLGGGALLHVGMFANNKSGVVYQDRSRRPETVVDNERGPHQQPRLPPSCTNEHLLQAICKIVFKLPFKHCAQHPP
jgi:hypothetical protein